MFLLQKNNNAYLRFVYFCVISYSSEREKKGVGLNRESNPGLSYPKGEFYHLTIEPLHFKLW